MEKSQCRRASVASINGVACSVVPPRHKVKKRIVRDALQNDILMCDLGHRSESLHSSPGVQRAAAHVVKADGEYSSRKATTRSPKGSLDSHAYAFHIHGLVRPRLSLARRCCRPLVSYMDGKPAKGLIVVFDPGATDAPRGVATTGGDGGYTVRRLGPGAKLGVPVGTYAVKVMADTDNPGAPRIPASYASGSTLSFEVKGSGNVFDIDISTK